MGRQVHRVISTVWLLRLTAHFAQDIFFVLKHGFSFQYVLTFDNRLVYQLFS